MASDSDGNVTFTPRWDGAIERYAKRWARTQQWRVRHLCDDVEDALGECQFVYAKCARLYDGKVTNAAWFMALYKRALARYWVQLARHEERYVRGLAAAREIAQTAPRSQPATAPLLAALARARDPSLMRRLVLQTPERAPPLQCGRVAYLTALRDLHTLLEAA